MTDDLVVRPAHVPAPLATPSGRAGELYQEEGRARGCTRMLFYSSAPSFLPPNLDHWDHYRENMFPAMEMEGELYPAPDEPFTT